MYPHLLIFNLFLLFFPFQTAQAAWPDSSSGRIEALKLLRKDIGSAMPIWEGTERDLAYQRICGMSKSYRPSCKSQKWTTDGRGDLKKAGAYFGAICDSRSEPLACVVSSWDLGFIGGIPSNRAKNPKKAIKRLENACRKKSYGPACAYWADFLAAGIGASKNLEHALVRYREACKANDLYGCSKLATFQMFGQGIQKDVVTAEETLDNACQAGMGSFCADLGLQHLIGVSLEKDPYMALDYFEKGCNSKDGRSCLLWSAEIAQHGGESHETNKAFAILSRSCKTGQKSSCSIIDKAHETGIFADNIHLEGPGFVTISADVSAKVFVDGKFIRKAPLFRHKLMDGKHRVYIVHPDGRAKKINLTINAGVEHAYKWSFSENKWTIKNQRTELWRLQAGLMLD